MFTHLNGQFKQEKLILRGDVFGYPMDNEGFGAAPAPQLIFPFFVWNIGD